jgi:hypothetical protein
MLIEPRHLCERRLRPKAGCDIQLPKATAELSNKRFCSSAEAPSMGVAANCGGASPTGTFKVVKLSVQRVVDVAFATHLRRQTSDRALAHESVGGARWDMGLHRPVHRVPGRPDRRAIRRHHLRPRYHPSTRPRNALRTTAAPVAGLLAWTPRRSRQHAVGSDLASSGPALPSSPDIAWLGVPPMSGSETAALASETRTKCRGRARVSNELSNYRGANLKPRLDDPGSFGAPGIGIDDHLACFTPKRSLVRTQYRPLPFPLMGLQ